MSNTISLYSVALFLHIVGALGLFIAIGLEWTSLLNLRRAATAEQAREWLKIFTSLRRIYPIAWLAILIPGFYMAATVWRGVAWITVSLAAVILIAALGAAVNIRRMGPIGQAAAVETGQLSADLRHRLADPLLWASLRIRTAIALGIVFLMTTKPGLVGALISMGVAVLLGLAFSLPVGRRNREQIRIEQASDRL